jgi:hypothetical protein
VQVKFEGTDTEPRNLEFWESWMPLVSWYDFCDLVRVCPRLEERLMHARLRLSTSGQPGVWNISSLMIYLKK